MSEKKTIRKSFFEFLINLLLGVAWAITVLGAFWGFTFFLNYGIYTAFVGSLFSSLAGLFFVVILEFIIFNFYKSQEVIKQTKILEDILEILKSKDEIISNN